jgi:hypothetical protein
MVTVLADTGSIPERAPIHLSFHVVATLNVTAEEAPRRVNRQVVTESCSIADQWTPLTADTLLAIARILRN